MGSSPNRSWRVVEKKPRPAERQVPQSGRRRNIRMARPGVACHARVCSLHMLREPHRGRLHSGLAGLRASWGVSETTRPWANCSASKRRGMVASVCPMCGTRVWLLRVLRVLLHACSALLCSDALWSGPSTCRLGCVQHKYAAPWEGMRHCLLNVVRLGASWGRQSLQPEPEGAEAAAAAYLLGVPSVASAAGRHRQTGRRQQGSSCICPVHSLPVVGPPACCQSLLSGILIATFSGARLLRFEFLGRCAAYRISTAVVPSSNSRQCSSFQLKHLTILCSTHPDPRNKKRRRQSME